MPSIWPYNRGHILLPPVIRSSPQPNCKEDSLNHFTLLNAHCPHHPYLHHLVFHLQLSMKWSHCWLPKNRVGKGENGHFTVETPGQHDLHQVIKANVTRDVIWNVPYSMMWCDVIWCEGHLTFVVLFPKTHTSSLIMKHKTNPNWGIFYRIPGQYFSRLSKP